MFLLKFICIIILKWLLIVQYSNAALLRLFWYFIRSVNYHPLYSGSIYRNYFSGRRNHAVKGRGYKKGHSRISRSLLFVRSSGLWLRSLHVLSELWSWWTVRHLDVYLGNAPSKYSMSMADIETACCDWFLIRWWAWTVRWVEDVWRFASSSVVQFQGVRLIDQRRAWLSSARLNIGWAYSRWAVFAVFNL